MAHVSAQISLYPLGSRQLSTVIDAVVALLADRGLDTRPGPMSTIVTGEDDEVFPALAAAFRLASQGGEAVMVLTVSNACPV